MMISCSVYFHSPSSLSTLPKHILELVGDTKIKEGKYDMFQIELLRVKSRFIPKNGTEKKLDRIFFDNNKIRFRNNVCGCNRYISKDSVHTLLS